MTQMYSVVLMRPVFERLEVEVEAEDELTAIRVASDFARQRPRSSWSSQSCHDDSYRFHVENIIDHEEVTGTSGNENGKVRNYGAPTDECGEVRYMLLAANIQSGEGLVVSQPWFEKLDWMQHGELCSHWVRPLEFIIENDGIETDDANMLSGDAGGRSNVIQFPKIPQNQAYHSNSGGT